MKASEWYSVLAVTRLTVFGAVPEISFDLSINIVRAANPTDARERYLAQLATEVETEYKNYIGETVQWKHERIVEIQEICTPHFDSDRVTEVFSWMQEGCPTGNLLLESTGNVGDTKPKRNGPSLGEEG